MAITIASRSRSQLPWCSSTDPATSEIYTLSLHDALPIFEAALGSGTLATELALESVGVGRGAVDPNFLGQFLGGLAQDRKSTRLNSSHGYISYAVFCLKKKTGPRATSSCLPARPPCRRSR